MKYPRIVTVLFVLMLMSCDQHLDPKYSSKESSTKQVANSSPDTFVDYLSVAELMNWVIDPAADAVWDSVSWISTLEGDKAIAPKNQKEWEALRSRVATLMEASNLLLTQGRAGDKPNWKNYAQALGASAKKTLAAVQAKDVQAVFDSGTEIEAACETCHLKYAYLNKPKAN